MALAVWNSEHYIIEVETLIRYHKDQAYDISVDLLDLATRTTQPDHEFSFWNHTDPEHITTELPKWATHRDLSYAGDTKSKSSSPGQGIYVYEQCLSLEAHVQKTRLVEETHYLFGFWWKSLPW